MKKAAHIFFVLLALTQQVFAQEVVLFHNVNRDTSEGDYGPNRKNYWQRVTQVGFHFGETDSMGSDIELGNSFEFLTGFRYKRQFGAFYAIGFQLDVSYSNYRIKQTDEKVFGGQVEHDKEKLSLLKTGMAFYQRFNFAFKRGNHLGKYLDLGVYSDVQFYRRYILIDKIDPLYGFEKHRTAFSKMTWLNNINYGVEARIGISFFYIFGKYRLSDMLKHVTSFPYPELPRFTVGFGFEIGDIDE
ncbi:MAG: hypothetical protein ACHQF2_11140 [Flavobacteriales bacterium]